MVQYLCQKEGKQQLDTLSTVVCGCHAQAYPGARARHDNDRSMNKQTLNGINSDLLACPIRPSECSDWVRDAATPRRNRHRTVCNSRGSSVMCTTRHPRAEVGQQGVTDRQGSPNR